VTQKQSSPKPRSRGDRAGVRICKEWDENREGIRTREGSAWGKDPLRAIAEDKYIHEQTLRSLRPPTRGKGEIRTTLLTYGGHCKLLYHSSISRCRMISSRSIISLEPPGTANTGHSLNGNTNANVTPNTTAIAATAGNITKTVLGIRARDGHGGW